MHICLYSETALPLVGGQELALDALAREFLAAGHQVTLLTQRQRRRQTLEEPDLPYPVVRHRRYVSTRHFLGWYCRSLESLYLRSPFDVLHCHNIFPAGVVAAQWARGRDVPLVLTSHACDISAESHLLRKPHVIPRVQTVLRHSQAIVAISELVESRFLALGATRAQLSRIPNGVDLASFDERVARPGFLSVPARPGDYFLFLGRLVARKGADLLLDAFQRMASSTTLDLVIAGDGEQRERLAAAVAERGLSRRVFLPGVVSGPAKTYLLQNARCVVVPSRISEGSSLVVWESYAAGRPVIGAAVPGLIEAVRPNQTGLLVTEDSVAELTAALTTAAARPELCDAWGDSARAWVQPYAWRRIAHRHVQLYTSLLEGRDEYVAPGRRPAIRRAA